MWRRLLSSPRLARNSMTALLDRHASVCVSTKDGRLTQGLIRWNRNFVVVEGFVESEAELGFKGHGPDKRAFGQFRLQMPRPRHLSEELFVSFSDSTQLVVKRPRPWFEAVARAAAFPKAVRVLWRTRNNIKQFLMSGDPTVAAALRREYGLTPDTHPGGVIRENLFDAVETASTPAVTVIIPVFNAANDVKRLLTRLSKTLPTAASAILVNDGSSDTELPALLEKFTSETKNTRLIRHRKNLGFVAAVNSGIEAAAKSDHIILLNTDTVPPNDWLPRLVAPIVDRPNDIASVTPFSNNAEILSVPYAGIETDPDEQLVDKIDSVAKKISPSPITLPTGIGFCMAMNRAFLDRLGTFDPAFGRGYGEEVDWCRRAIAAGGHHVTAPLFVGHRGGASFGEEKAKRLQSAGAIINKRYPTYEQEVYGWIADAPLNSERLVLALAWLAARQERVSIFLGHSLGGGAEHALMAEVAGLLEQKALGVVVLRVGGASDWRIELHLQGYTLAGDASGGLTEKLLSQLECRRIVYSCGVGHANPVAAPSMLEHLYNGCRDARLEIRLHDFFPVSPSWNLLDSRGCFAGIPDWNSQDPAHQPGGPDAVSHREWRETWDDLIAKSDKITAFSPSSIDLFCCAYPKAIGKIVCEPHSLPVPMPKQMATGGKSIGILGGINLPKGGAVIEALSKQTRRKIVVIGEMDGQFRLRSPHVVHGRYDRTKITELAKDYDIGLWLIPSVCPETFSFATHEALATGLPVLGFDVGAQGETLAKAGNGFALPIDPDDTAKLSSYIEKHFR